MNTQEPRWLAGHFCAPTDRTNIHNNHHDILLVSRVIGHIRDEHSVQLEMQSGPRTCGDRTCTSWGPICMLSMFCWIASKVRVFRNSFETADFIASLKYLPISTNTLRPTPIEKPYVLESQNVTRCESSWSGLSLCVCDSY